MGDCRHPAVVDTTGVESASGAWPRLWSLAYARNHFNDHNRTALRPQQAIRKAAHSAKDKMANNLKKAVFSIGLLTLWLMAHAQQNATSQLPPATGNVLLTVTGAIDNFNADARAELDLALLKSLPAVTVETSTPWTSGKQSFTGVRVDDLLNRLGARSQEFRALALDDYVIDVSDVDFGAHAIIIAYKRNGQYMKLRDLGPLWIIFPIDDHPQFGDPKHLAFSVWQLNAMIVR